MTGATPDEAREFATEFRAFLQWVHSPDAQGGRGSEVARLIEDHLGADAASYSVVAKSLPVFEQVNLQTALDAWMREAGRTADVHGQSIPPHFGSISLQQLLTGEGLPPIRLTAPPLVDLPNGPGSTLACILRAVILVRDSRGPYAILISGPNEHEPILRVEIAGLAVEAAQAVHAELADLRLRLNVYRGHMLHVGMNDMGGVTLDFAEPPDTAREDVILDDVVLARIERHALGIAEHRADLLSAGQHLKRGLLLYGPPGTGKTHTTRYLMGRLAGYTRLVLTGRALHAVGAVAEMARTLQPAAVVLEDVDLVAEDRSFGFGSNPILFDLLDAMDGAAADADLLFVLTTNRADLLEPALAARPGRVDVAVGIDLPDETARRRLFDLYAKGVPVELSAEERDEIAARSAGVTASFLKELIRRAVLESLQQGSAADTSRRTVTGEHFRQALDDLLDSAQGVTRSLLGVSDGSAPGAEGDEEAGAGAYGPVPSRAPAVGWAAYTPMRAGVRRRGRFGP